MFGLGFGEIVVIAIIVLIAVGPDRLPTLMKTVGGTMRQLRQASRDIRSTVGLDELIDLDDRLPPRRPVVRADAPKQAGTVAQGSAHGAVAQGTVAQGTVSPVGAPNADVAPSDTTTPGADGSTPSTKQS